MSDGGPFPAITGTVDPARLIEVAEAARDARISVLVAVGLGDEPQVTIKTSRYGDPGVEVQFGEQHATVEGDILGKRQARRPRHSR